MQGDIMKIFEGTMHFTYRVKEGPDGMAEPLRRPITQPRLGADGFATIYDSMDRYTSVSRSEEELADPRKRVRGIVKRLRNLPV